MWWAKKPVVDEVPRTPTPGPEPRQVNVGKALVTVTMYDGTEHRYHIVGTLRCCSENQFNLMLELATKRTFIHAGPTRFVQLKDVRQIDVEHVQHLVPEVRGVLDPNTLDR